MTDQKRVKFCGNPECGVSTHIGECLSFGSGELDENGFWEKPCYICARKNEEIDKARGYTKYLPYWP